MNARPDFACWLRERRQALVAGEHASEALRALGLDERGLGALARAERVVVTLPHASPNVFFPRAGVAWYARHLQRGDPELLHLRVALTHINFSDLGWRPYAWWHLDAGGRLRRTTFFTRNKKRKHVVVCSRPPLGEVAEPLHGADAEAARLARAGADLAVSCMLVTATVERAAGVAPPGRAVYVPLSLLARFAAEAAGQGGEDGAQRWLARLAGAAPGRRVDERGELAGAAGSLDADVFDNATNIALLAALGADGVLGGAKMAGYWPAVRARCEQASVASGVPMPPPQLLTFPAGVDYAALVPPSPPLARQLEAAGIGYSQGMALSEHGRFAERIDPFVAGPAALSRT